MEVAAAQPEGHAGFTRVDAEYTCGLPEARPGPRQAWSSPSTCGRCCWAGRVDAQLGPAPCTLILTQTPKDPEWCRSDEFRLLSASSGDSVEIFENRIWKMLLVTCYRKILVWGGSWGGTEAEQRLRSIVLCVSISEKVISLKSLPNVVFCTGQQASLGQGLSASSTLLHPWHSPWCSVSSC